LEETRFASERTTVGAAAAWEGRATPTYTNNKYVLNLVELIAR